MDKNTKSKKKVTFGEVKICFFEPEEYFSECQQESYEIEDEDEIRRLMVLRNAISSFCSSPSSSPLLIPEDDISIAEAYSAPKRPLVSDDNDEAPPSPKRQRVGETSVEDLDAFPASPPVGRRVLVPCYEVLDDEEEECFSPILGSPDGDVYDDDEKTFGFWDPSVSPSLSPPHFWLLPSIPLLSLPPPSTSDSSTEDE